MKTILLDWISDKSSYLFTEAGFRTFDWLDSRLNTEELNLTPEEEYPYENHPVYQLASRLCDIGGWFDSFHSSWKTHSTTLHDQETTDLPIN